MLPENGKSHWVILKELSLTHFTRVLASKITKVETGAADARKLMGDLQITIKDALQSVFAELVLWASGH